MSRSVITLLDKFAMRNIIIADETADKLDEILSAIETMSNKVGKVSGAIIGEELHKPYELWFAGLLYNNQYEKHPNCKVTGTASSYTIYLDPNHKHYSFSYHHVGGGVTKYNECTYTNWASRGYPSPAGYPNDPNGGSQCGVIVVDTFPQSAPYVTCSGGYQGYSGNCSIYKIGISDSM